MPAPLFRNNDLAAGSHWFLIPFTINGIWFTIHSTESLAKA
jgi:hypothetical protein